MFNYFIVLALITSTAFGQNLYVEKGGPNPLFSELGMVRGQTCTSTLFDGSTIDVNNTGVEAGLYMGQSLSKDIKLHTLCNSSIAPTSFKFYKRWYQVDGNTQIFRLFKDEENTRNDRLLAARIEAFSAINWKFGDGWYEWTGRYTISEKGGQGFILQVKNNIDDWAVALGLSSDGTLTINHRRHQDDKVIAENLNGKSFDIRVIDNGRDYKVYLNNSLVGEGYLDRSAADPCSFRWGMYFGASAVTEDRMIFTSNVNCKKLNILSATDYTLSATDKTLMVYPNPSQKLFNIKGDISTVKSMEVYSLKGKLLLVKDDSFETVDLGSIESGIYFLKITTDKDVNTFKLVKQ